MASMFDGFSVQQELSSGMALPGFNGGIANQQLPTDPLFYANITLQNIVIGSQYWIAQASDLSNVLATGTAAATEVELTNIPAYANPMLIETRVRKGTSGTRYEVFKTYGYLVREGATIYVSQAESPVG